MPQGAPEALLATIAPSGMPEWLSQLQHNAQRAGAMQAAYIEKQTQLWSALLGGKHESVVEVEPGDRRFAAKAWDENPYYGYLKQSYLLASRYVLELVEASDMEAE